MNPRAPSSPRVPEAVRFLPRPHCPACAHPDRETVADLPFAAPPLSTYLASFYGPAIVARLRGLPENRYRLARCAACGTHYQVDVPPADWLAEFYGAIQAPGDETVPTFIFDQRARELAMVARQLDASALPKRALDFGAGLGGWARLAHAAGFNVSVMDVATNAFPALEAAGIRCTLPFATDEHAFSLIHLEQVLEHLADPADTLNRLCARLAPEGILVLGVPHDPALAEKLRAPDWLAPKSDSASLNAVAPLEHLNAFSPLGLRQLAARFNLIELQPQGWTLHRADRLPADLRTRIATRLRRRLREQYQPAWALSQTVFLQRPAAA